MDSKIKVSVVCLVYNHENYIRSCLDGFVNQKCNFAFEVLVHDDASTDNSARIIKEYEEKYPDVIKPVYQSENQYSKGKGIIRNILLPTAKGEYLAWCEGDDCWIDSTKLQKQVDFLDSHPDYSACVHNAVWNNVSTQEQRVFPNVSSARYFTTDEIIKLGGGYFSTNSLVFRKDYYENMPKCFRAKGFGDYQLFIYASIAGKVWFLPDVMSLYNCGVKGSWTERVWNNVNEKIRHYEELIRLLNAIDEHYKQKYHSSIEYKIVQTEFLMYQQLGDKGKLKEQRYKTFVHMQKKALRKEKIYKFIKARFPFILKIRRFIRKK